MNYTPRYTYWLYKANVLLNELPGVFTNLIIQYEKAYALWQDANESEQKKYKKIVEQTDAFISAKIVTLYQTQINEQNESDTLKALMSKAADLDF